VVFQTKRDPDDAFHRGHPLSFWQQFLALAQNHCGQLQPSSGSGHPQGRIQWWIRFYESISSPSLTRAAQVFAGVMARHQIQGVEATAV